jgi:hypothetical protein
MNIFTGNKMFRYYEKLRDAYIKADQADKTNDEDLNQNDEDKSGDEDSFEVQTNVEPKPTTKNEDKILRDQTQLCV